MRAAARWVEPNNWAVVVSEDGEVHVVPLFSHAHDLGYDCWCQPKLDPETKRHGGLLFIHEPPN